MTNAGFGLVFHRIPHYLFYLLLFKREGPSHNQTATFQGNFAAGAGTQL